jgi:folylpolyglutamate synthase/dihydrofolate synthase
MSRDENALPCDRTSALSHVHRDSRLLVAMSIDLTLDRIRTLSLHLPPYTRPTCHIVGTNGKGSVSALLSSMLFASTPPLSVGRFNSPHLVSIYDCIVINGENVMPDAYASARAEVERVEKKYDTGASSFELLTLTALMIFEHAKLDIVIIEAGMGGRLDATNIIPDEAIVVSALTAVDLDHQAFLGDTVHAIAQTKAGIARIGRPFVVGAQTHPEVEESVKTVIAARGGDMGWALRVVARAWDPLIDGPEPLPVSLSASGFQAPSSQPVEISIPCFSETVRALLPLHGNHQLDNLGLASSVISTLLTHPSCTHLNLRGRITPDSVTRGIKATKWLGRLSFHTLTLRPSLESETTFECSPLTVLADGAHNPASSTTLANYITHLLSLVTHAKVAPRSISLTYILALSHSPPKTPLQTLTPLLPPTIPPYLNVSVNVGLVRFTPPEGMPWVKSVAPSELREVVRSIAPGVDVWAVGDEEQEQEQLPRAFEWATVKSGTEGLIILGGSLYLVADFYRMLRGH